MKRTPSRRPDQDFRVWGRGDRRKLACDDADFSDLGRLQNFGASALGMVGVLGVDVKDEARKSR